MDGRVQDGGERFSSDALLLHPAFRHVVDAGRHLFARGDQLIVLEGAAAERLLPRLLPHLDGTASAAEIASTLPEQARPAAHSLLTRLIEEGLVMEVPASLASSDRAAREATAFILATSAHLSVAAAFERLQNERIITFGTGTVASMVREQLLDLNIDSSVRDWDLDAREAQNVKLVVAAPAPSELSRMTLWNETALELGVPWLQVLPWEGRYIAVGPLYIPKETCCFECYRIRRSVNLTYGADEALLIDLAPTVEAPRWVASVAAGLVVDTLYRWLATKDPYLPAKFTAVEFVRGLTLSQHWVLRVPRCPACSTVAQQSPLVPWYDDLD